QVPAPARRYFLFTLGEWVYWRAPQLASALSTVDALGAAPGADAREGVFREWSEMIPADVAPGALRPDPRWSPDDTGRFWRGVGRHAVRVARRSLSEELSAPWLLASTGRERALEGVGEEIVGQWRFGPGRGLARFRDLNGIPTPLRAPVLRGVGRGLGEFTLCDETVWIEARLAPVIDAFDRDRLEEGRVQTIPLARSCY
ncbi:MAG: hypothetical protein ACREBE_25905, partial [bacterium]